MVVRRFHASSSLKLPCVSLVTRRYLYGVSPLGNIRHHDHSLLTALIATFRHWSSTSASSTPHQDIKRRKPSLQVIQFRASRKGQYEEQLRNRQIPSDATVYTSTMPDDHDDANFHESCDDSTVDQTGMRPIWQKQSPDLVDQDLEPPPRPQDSRYYYFFHHSFLRHFLPAQYPSSVATGYAHFAGAAFVASVAGSASMVLSTQTLLLAVGVVGNHTTTVVAEASVLAGALNWVAKDFIGQLGGVLFASRMGEAKQYDGNPKKWRMVAALVLDAACLLEILSPTLGSNTVVEAYSSSSSSSYQVLAIASTANVLKNIGFLTAGASRAALHQSLAVTGNLADVTAKAASQSMAAGLLGTGLGIALSSSNLLMATAACPPTVPFAMAFGVLAMIHQGCNYVSLSSIHLTHMDKHRLYILLQEFVDTQQVLSPMQVSEREVWFWPRQDDTQDWLAIGSELVILCPGGGAELDQLLTEAGTAKYLLNVVDGRIHLSFLQDAGSECLIQGVLAALTLHRSMQEESRAHDLPTLRQKAHESAARQRPVLLKAMKEKGWKTGPGETNVEPNNAVRFDIRRQ